MELKSGKMRAVGFGSRRWKEKKRSRNCRGVSETACFVYSKVFRTCELCFGCKSEPLEVFFFLLLLSDFFFFFTIFRINFSFII